MSSSRPRRAAAAFLVLVAGCASAPGSPVAPRDPATVAVREAAHPLAGGPTDYDPLLASLGDAEVVVLGESTHGTREFYRERARITARLVREHGFRGVVLEAPWASTVRVNHYVRGLSTDSTPEAALADFDEFPRWLWRNEEMREVVRVLRERNRSAGAAEQVGIYGMDLYGMFAAADHVVAYLARRDSAGAARAREAYGCFEPYRPDGERYGARAVARTCRPAAAAVLEMVEGKSGPRAANIADGEDAFAAVRNARAVVSAEEFYRLMFTGGASTWNLRDGHMAETIEAVRQHLAWRGRPGKVVVWTHNTHAGDARATDAGGAGELTLGQLLRERHGHAAALVGFFTYAGTVLAAPGWGQPARAYDVPPAQPGSIADLFHASGQRRFLLMLREGVVRKALAGRRPQRAIGVVYLPEMERRSHYYRARIAKQFDAAVFLDSTTALAPLALN